jgi:hypothetical protein
LVDRYNASDESSVYCREFVEEENEFVLSGDCIAEDIVVTSA